ncbi:MAG: YfcE family phosphodiesterase [Spirochaetes bacterium]|nr:MAG: YfcE family phosphodiesterase [Spirochaetota bacterium]
MKILVVSDSHGNSAALARIVERELPFEILVHCGDGVRDLAQLRIPRSVRVVGVTGNMDRAVVTGREVLELFELPGFKFLVTHGDRQRAHEDYLGLLDEAHVRGADIVLFGHTHRPFLREGRPSLFNPGAAQQGFYGTVLVSDRIEFFHKRWEAPPG